MKKTLLIVSCIALLLTIPVVVFFIGQSQDVRSKAAPNTTLSIVPSSPEVAFGDTAIVKVVINTGENRVATVKASVVFDGTKFEAMSITNGALTPKILNQGTVGVGTATITVAAENTTKPITGQGDVATLRLKAIAGSATPVQIAFGADTSAVGLGETNTNVLVSSSPGSISITGGPILADSTVPTISATPTPSRPASTPTATPKMPESFPAQTTSSSALTTTVFAEATRSGLPLIQGTASPSATVTIAIHSQPPQSLVTTSDAKGNWKATPLTALKAGTYTAVVTAQTSDARSPETISTQFTISGGIGGGEASEATGDEMPNSGSTHMTTLLIIGSLACIGLGSLLFLRNDL